MKYGKWTILERCKNKKGDVYVKCKCDCGNVKEVCLRNIEIGASKSCGCNRIASMRKVGITNSKNFNEEKRRLRIVWSSMKQRIFDKNSKPYHRYGDRGLGMSSEWLDFENFYKWAVENNYKKGLSIERTNNNIGYFPENCCWATYKEQNRNREKSRIVFIDGVTKHINEWAEQYGIPISTINSRFHRGLRGKDLISPINQEMHKIASFRKGKN